MVDEKQPPDWMTVVEAFDGKHVQSLEVVARSWAPDQFPLDDLLHLAASKVSREQIAATWLLKRCQERGSTLAPDQVHVLIGTLHVEADPAAHLHVLQMLGALDIPRKSCGGLLVTLRRHIEHPNKFVRAWAYNGLAVLADQEPGLRAECTELLSHGEQDAAASVQARLRNVMKSYDWLG